MRTSRIISLGASVATIATILTDTYDNTVFIGMVILYCTSFIIRELEKINEKL